jgi:hypothetical protein
MRAYNYPLPFVDHPRIRTKSEALDVLGHLVYEFRCNAPGLDDDSSDYWSDVERHLFREALQMTDLTEATVRAWSKS